MAAIFGTASAPRFYLGALARPGKALGAALACLVPFAVYVASVAPTVWWLDSAELTTGAYTLGIVHAPGSPLFLLLGHLFTYLPLGDVGYRLNLMCACTSALTAGFIFLIVEHLTRRAWLAVATAWFTAFGFYVWMAAVAAELYSLDGCFVTGLLFLALKWREQQQPWQLCALAFLFGLGTGNHISLALMLPGYTLLALATPLPWRQTRWLFAATVAGFLGGLIWLYLPLRYNADPVMNYAQIWGVALDTWSGFWWMITGQMFESMFFGLPLAAMPDRIVGYGYQLWSNFFGIGVLFGLWGLVRDAPRRPILHAALLLMFVGHLVFYLPYNAVDENTMLLPSFLIWAIWSGLGAFHIEQWLAGGSFESATPVVLVALALTMLGFNYSRASLRGNWSAQARGEQIFQAVQPRAVFFGTWIDEPILEYLQYVESRRPDVKLVNVLFHTPAEQSRVVARALKNGRPVYTTVPNFLTEFGFDNYKVRDCRCLRITFSRPWGSPNKLRFNDVSIHTH